MAQDRINHNAPVSRFWQPLGGTSELDGAGWLIDPTVPVFGEFFQNTSCLETFTLAEIPCVILLGEPGMGKSHTLYDNLDALSGGVSWTGRIVAHDLKDMTTKDDFRHTVLNDPQISDWMESDDNLCLILDSLDEAERMDPGLHKVFASQIKQWHKNPRWTPDRLLLRIVCRTSDWKSSLEDALTTAYGFDKVERYILLPLRKRDVINFLPDSSVASDFLIAVENANAVPLASRPLTLNMLARTYKSDRGLPGKASELYRRGLLALCDEHDPGRRDNGAIRTVSPSEILKAAKWIAALSVFRQRPTIWRGYVSEASDSDLTDDECATDDYYPAIQAALGTALFSEAGAHRAGWAHSTFMDFLAAQWVIDNSLEKHQVRSLLCFDERSIYPQTSMVAAWLVTCEPDTYGWLVAIDPESLLTGLDIPDDNLRRKIVDEIFDRARRGEFFRDFRHDFSKLRHPGLAEQIRQGLRDSDDELKRLAFNIGRSAGITEVVPDFSSIVLDSANPQWLRTAAALAVYDLCGSDTTGNLAPLLPQLASKLAANPSEGEELFAAVALASWPNEVPTSEMVRMINHVPLSIKGSNYWLLVHRLTESLIETESDAVAEWLKENDDLWLCDDLGPLLDKAVDICLRCSRRAEFIPTVAKLARKRAVEFKGILLERDAGSLPLEGRRALALELLGINTTQHELAKIATDVGSGRPILEAEDFSWLVEQYSSVEDERRVAVGKTIALLFSPDNSEHVEKVEGLPSDHPVACQVLRYFTGAIEPDPEMQRLHEEWRRQRMETEQKQAQLDTEVDSEISALTARVEAGETEAYWGLLRTMTVKPGTQYYQDSQPDLTQHERWSVVDAYVRNVIIAAVPSYLAMAKCQPELWLEKNNRHFPSEAAYKALVLLLRTDPDGLERLPGAVWREWAPILVAWPTPMLDVDPAIKGDLLAHAWSHARKELTDSLLRVLDDRAHRGQQLFLTVEIHKMWTNELGEQLVERFNCGLPAAAREELVRTVAEIDFALLKPLLRQWVVSSESRAADLKRSYEATYWLLSRDAAGFWGEFTDLMENDPEFVQQAFLDMATVDRTVVPDVSPDQLGALYLWSVDRFPPEEDPDVLSLGVHRPSLREILARWRGNILNSLVSKGTEEAIAVVEDIAQTHPQEPYYRRVLRDVRAVHTRERWRPMSREQLQTLAQNANSTLVRTEADLLECVLETLSQIQFGLQGDTSISPFLWDEGTEQKPKSEDRASDLLRYLLNLQLQRRGIVINREVQARRFQPSGMGERTDILIEAITENGPDHTALRVVAEVKGCWNKAELYTALKEQLADRYMRDMHTRLGVYIVLWFDKDSWSTKDNRRRNVINLDLGDLRNELEKQARALDSRGNNIRVVILDASYGRPPVTDEIAE
ncbi:NACHT domain-containing protein [Nocardia sp. NPDC051570]|uniref:NACHT domain-containing protein n=1 Tax=Nocardia sp. NPDC051570 TaxID=3364324 RepID=UPI0037B1A9FC